MGNPGIGHHWGPLVSKMREVQTRPKIRTVARRDSEDCEGTGRRMFVRQLSKCSAKADLALRKRAYVGSKHEQHSTRHLVPALRWKASESSALGRQRL